ncbi:MAG: hypothetical protein RLW68_15210 [Devosia marina]|uniref:DUF6894 domain-containing protein n=1 Tax=Devosia marina TaxID=2683198 RepID=A0A7X3FPQ2_9HYPH|nr:hypothetical protein [Devosia marina]MVS98308.1 hypothetical protein [Devosia marina]
MERYFFNHRDQSGDLQIDIDGIMLPSLHSAVDEASFAASNALGLSDGPIRGCFEIEDGARKLVARVPYAVESDRH